MLGAVDYLSKPVVPPIVLARVRTHLALQNQNRELDRKVAEKTSELDQTRLLIIQKLGLAAEYRDNETGMHIIRMSHFTRLIAGAMDISDEWTELAFAAAPMHDIGKIGIPDRVLLKQGKLDADERREIEQHPSYGASILGEHDDALLHMARMIALSHHERWDGKGYPQGLSGNDIPLAARVVSVADVFDALTSERPYKKAWDIDEAAELIVRESGGQFDPGVVAAFQRVFPEILEIKDRYKDGSAPTV